MLELITSPKIIFLLIGAFSLIFFICLCASAGEKEPFMKKSPRQAGKEQSLEDVIRRVLRNKANQPQNHSVVFNAGQRPACAARRK